MQFDNLRVPIAGRWKRNIVTAMQSDGNDGGRVTFLLTIWTTANRKMQSTFRTKTILPSSNQQYGLAPVLNKETKPNSYFSGTRPACCGCYGNSINFNFGSDRSIGWLVGWLIGWAGWLTNCIGAIAVCQPKVQISSLIAKKWDSLAIGTEPGRGRRTRRKDVISSNNIKHDERG